MANITSIELEIIENYAILQKVWVSSGNARDLINIGKYKEFKESK